jgi:peptidyl-prolyl cis-trans isomerase D
MANREKKRVVSKKHLARVERERIQTRNLTIISIVVIATVLILIAVGIIDAYVVTPNKPVAIVNGEEISSNDFIARVSYERLQLVGQFNNTYQFMQSFSDPQTQSFFTSSLQQIGYQLEPVVMNQQAINTMVEDVLLGQEAERRGIVISEADIDEYIATRFFGYYTEGTPTPEPTFEPIPTSTLSPLQLTLVPPTPTATAVVTETEALTSTEGITVTIEPDATPTAAPTAVPPTATPYTASEYAQDLQNTIDSLQNNIKVNEDEFRMIAKSVLIREKLMEIITKDLKPEEEQVWVRHILVGDEATAQEILERLENGENFAELASLLSTDTGSAAQGGDLGWFGRGRMVAPFEEAAFSQEIGEIGVVQSDFGWHVIQVLGHEVRPIDAAAFDQLKQQTFDDWLAAQRESAEIEIFDVQIEKVAPVEPSIPQSVLDQLASTSTGQ